MEHGTQMEHRRQETGNGKWKSGLGLSEGKELDLLENKKTRCHQKRKGWSAMESGGRQLVLGRTE